MYSQRSGNGWSLPGLVEILSCRRNDFVGHNCLCRRSKYMFPECRLAPCRCFRLASEMEITRTIVVIDVLTENQINLIISYLTWRNVIDNEKNVYFCTNIIRIIEATFIKLVFLSRQRRVGNMALVTRFLIDFDTYFGDLVGIIVL